MVQTEFGVFIIRMPEVKLAQINFHWQSGGGHWCRGEKQSKSTGTKNNMFGISSLYTMYAYRGDLTSKTNSSFSMFRMFIKLALPAICILDSQSGLGSTRTVCQLKTDRFSYSPHSTKKKTACAKRQSKSQTARSLSFRSGIVEGTNKRAGELKRDARVEPPINAAGDFALARFLVSLDYP